MVGKSRFCYNLTCPFCNKMQDLLSLALMMRRGKSKSETGIEHLERSDFIVAKQKQEAKEAMIKLHDTQTAVETAKEECADLSST